MAGNAAIYISDPSLLGSRLLDSFEEIQTYDGLEDERRATGLSLEFKDFHIQMNFMPKDNISAHLLGFKGFIHRVCKDEDTLIYLSNRLKNVTFVLGCIITPDLGQEAKDFLFTFNASLNGLLFINNQVFDYNKIALTEW